MSHRGEDGVTAWSGVVKREDCAESLLERGITGVHGRDEGC